MENLTQYIPLVLAALLILTALKIFTKPIRFVFKLLLNTLLGFAALMIINFLGQYFGIRIELNWLNAAVTGIFGIPGLAVLLIFNYFSL